MAMMRKIITILMEQPLLYKFVQEVLNGDGHKKIKKFLKKEIPSNAKKILDQGCGTGEYSFLFPKRYTGIDNSKEDIEFATYKKYPGKFIVGSATKMNLLNNNFDAVFAVGLHHHLSKLDAKKAVNESLKVLKKGGKLVIIDAMPPVSKFNLIGLILRKLDRGAFIRKPEETAKFLPPGLQYKLGVIRSFPLDFVTIIAKKT